MMPEIGNALLCLALGVALLLSVYPLWGVARGDVRMMGAALCLGVVYLCDGRVPGAGQRLRG
jgi:cytochrome c-type biogenesis protein CcmF